MSQISDITLFRFREESKGCQAMRWDLEDSAGGYGIAVRLKSQANTKWPRPFNWREVEIV